MYAAGVSAIAYLPAACQLHSAVAETISWHLCTASCYAQPQTICSSAAKSVLDMGAALLVVATNSTHAVRLASKYRPGVPLLVLTQQRAVASQAALINGAYAYHLPQGEKPPLLKTLVEVVSDAHRQHE
jgi:pyruvate kinase